MLLFGVGFLLSMGSIAVTLKHVSNRVKQQFV